MFNHACLPWPHSPLQIESKTVHKRELLASDEERRLQQLESKLTGGHSSVYYLPSLLACFTLLP